MSPEHFRASRILDTLPKLGSSTVGRLQRDAALLTGASPMCCLGRLSWPTLNLVPFARAGPVPLLALATKCQPPRSHSGYNVETVTILVQSPRGIKGRVLR